MGPFSYCAFNYVFHLTKIYCYQAIKESIAEGEDPRLSSFSSPGPQVQAFSTLTPFFAQELYSF